MPSKKTPIVEGEFYHVYNRGVDKRDIFFETYDIERFIDGIVEFNTEEPLGGLREYLHNKRNVTSGDHSKTEKLVDIVAYCLNPNHYHILVQARSDTGVSEFTRRLSIGYTGYFNAKQERTGVLLQGRTKVKHIDTNEYLLHVSAYINLNYRIHGFNEDDLVKSSFDEYREDIQGICKKDIILDQFHSREDYGMFAGTTVEATKNERLFQKFIKNIEME